MNQEKSVRKNVLLNVFKTLMQLIFPLITFPYASRVLLPDGLGKVNFAQSIISYFALFASLGVGMYGVREGAKVRDNRAQLSKLTREILNINIVSTAIAYVLLIVSLLCVSKFSDYRFLLCILGSSILFTTFNLEWLYNAIEEYQYITIRSIVFQFISLVLLFIFVRSHDDYLQYAAISVFSNAGSGVLNFIYSRKFVDIAHIGKCDYRKHLKPIFILFGMSLTVSVYTVLDSTMLGFMVNDEAVGIYAAATKINKLVISLITALNVVLLPRLSFYVQKENITYFDALLQKSINILLAITIPVACGLFLLAGPIVDLFSGPAYASAVVVMQIMTPVVIFISFGSLLGMQVIIPKRMEKYMLYSELLGASINFSLNLLLIPRLGVIGASIATLVAEGTVTTTLLFWTRRVIITKDILISLIQCITAAAIMVACVLPIVSLFSKDVTKLVTGVIVGVVSYGLVLLVFRHPAISQLIRKRKRV